MKIFKTLLISLFFAFNLSTALANQDHKKILIEKPIVREVPNVAVATAAFMTLKNTSDEDVFLVSAKSSVANTVELHTHNMSNGVMKMRQVEQITIPANSSVQLKPSGLHIMLIELTQDLTKKTRVPLELIFKDGSSLKIEAPIKSVKKPNSSAMHMLNSDEKKTLKKTKTLDLCVNYSTHATKKEQEETVKELLARNQLSEKDVNNLKTGLVETSNTMCGMYMILGKPLQEKSRQLRVMVFKTVHVYPTNYFVTQMGMVVEKHERKEGAVPPSLSVEMPKVQGPPVKFIAPGGRPVH